MIRRLVFNTLIIIVGFVLITSFKVEIKGLGYFVLIDKSDYELRLYDANNNWLGTYPVVFGNKDLGDKMEEGDRRTPEGTYYIIQKKVHPKWDKFLGIDFPNQQDIEKFNDRKARGIIEPNAKIGGAIGIHGTWPHEDFAIDQYQNWTEGCISTKNEYIEELFKKLPIGTKVIIQR